jgi:hypothetical protein
MPLQFSAPQSRVAPHVKAIENCLCNNQATAANLLFLPVRLKLLTRDPVFVFQMYTIVHLFKFGPIKTGKRHLWRQSPRMDGTTFSFCAVKTASGLFLICLLIKQTYIFYPEALEFCLLSIQFIAKMPGAKN